MKINSLYPIVTTNDFLASLRFYTETLEFSVKHAPMLEGRYSVAVLENKDGLALELVEAAPLPCAPSHGEPGLFGLRVNVANIDSAYAEFRQKGYEILREPEDMDNNNKITRAMLVKDPNGVILTVMEHIHKS